MESAKGFPIIPHNNFVGGCKKMKNIYSIKNNK